MFYKRILQNCVSKMKIKNYFFFLIKKLRIRMARLMQKSILFVKHILSIFLLKLYNIDKF